MTPEQRLADLGIELPQAPKPVASYVPAARAGDLVFVSGQVPIEGGNLTVQGRVPTQVDETRAHEAARLCAINGLAVLKAELGSLDKVRRIVRIGVFVASDYDFGGQPGVANGASDLLVEVFGEAGRHARAAVGCTALPLNVPVEVELLVEVGE